MLLLYGVMRKRNGIVVRTCNGSYGERTGSVLEMRNGPYGRGTGSSYRRVTGLTVDERDHRTDLTRGVYGRESVPRYRSN